MENNHIHEVYVSDDVAELSRQKREEAKRNASKIRAEILADSSNYRSKYFLTYDEREILPEGDYSTAYIEFYIGKWDGKHFHAKNSMYLAYNSIDSVIIGDFIVGIIGMDPYGLDAYDITRDKWIQVGRVVQSSSDTIQKVYKEIDTWINRVFDTGAIVSLIPM